MADAEGESLESWLNKATNPSNRQEDWEYIIGFCDQINKELEGPQIAVRLLAHKIQSPQEWEAIQALMVLEACMKNCGKRFHNEVGKFRFLNELIKVVSPKYLGDRVSEVVKKRVVDMLFSWTLSLPNEAKISDAYQMLKKQGIVTVDPELPLDKTLMPSPFSRPKNPVFENEEKSKRLAELLKSKKPEDLQEANRLIKNMVKEDEVRLQRASKRSSTLEEVNNSVKLLNEMLSHFSRDQSTDGDKELIKELYGDCDKLRGTVFKLATETEDNDSSLGDILQASDDLSRVINSYKRIVEGQTVNGEMEPLGLSTTTQCTKDSNQSEILVDLAGLDLQSPSPPEHPPLAQHADFIPADLLYGSAPLQDLQACPAMEDPSPRKPSAALSLLDKELLSLGLNDPVPAKDDLNNLWRTFLQAPNPVLDLFGSALPATVFSAASTDQLGASTTEPVSKTAAPQSSVAASFPYPSAAAQAVSASFPYPSAAAQAVSASLNHSLQDLAMLDLGSPKSMPGVINSGDLFGMGEAMGATASPRIGIPASRSSPLPLGILPAAAAAAPTLSPKTQADDSPLLRSLSPILILPLGQASPAKFPEISLSNVHVPLEAIKPSKLCPVTAYDKDGVRVLLHFATDCPPGRPDVLVMVVSMLNTAPLPVRNIVLQAAVPKSMKVRLQPPSGTDLAPFNPIFPPTAITQVMLLANPLMVQDPLFHPLLLGEGPDEIQADVHTGRAAVHRDWGGGPVPPS
ncbi:ADP-ribosylation factor-binding protein GGA3-like isoform X2 [Oncorhynchus nerka]|uniref:ADP-ribosylation factor-binding protein GGA3-like isoform X2 n=1 Tax=Oncorhynchus nerka TaxID=8023 RepID=UPI0011317BA7|nr:ADP-ribosylation factor-binding protein GGA3-like isoform X2 [Oncorhynchus nerka]